MNDVMPPNFVFLNLRKPLGEMRRWETLYGFKEFSFPKKGGFLAHYSGRPVPNKGMAYSASTEANNVNKRLTIGMVMMLKPTPTNILTHYKRLADYLYDPHYLHTRYYNDCSRELMGFVYRFLRRLRFSFELSYGFARIPAQLLEGENAYRYRVEDLFGETTKEKLLANPRKELKRLEKIYLERETYIDEEGTDKKFKMVFKVLNLLLLIPLVKKAFRFALKDSEFKNFQMDEIETYWSDRHNEYHFRGLPYGIRQLKQGFKLLC